MKRMRPQIIDEMPTDIRDPPKGHVLGIISEPNPRGQKFARALDRLGLSGLKREIEVCQGPADRCVQNHRNCIVEINLVLHDRAG